MRNTVIKRLLILLALTLLGGAGLAEQGGTAEGAEESTIAVAAVPGIPEDFIRGMDASIVQVEEASGVVYYGFDGQPQDVFCTLAQAGVNAIRIRVWNDPYDAAGHGYGGGNNDVPTAIALGKRATQYGMGVCVDFHYSDFWADPKRQHAPKAWAGMSVDEKCAALYDFTVQSLSAMLDAGVDVTMVQIGNEINSGLADETGGDVYRLLNSGSRAVRDVARAHGKDIQIAVHYTNIDRPDGILRVADALAADGVDYDVFGLSYYPYWHGSLENMQAVVRGLIERTGKKVAIMETAYCYTDQDGDGSGNSVSGAGDIVAGYPASVQGQASMVRDVMAAAWEAGAMGVFYWEGAWVPVGPADADNSPVWERCGSGWASSWAADYDPEDAGLYYGGSAWDNQAMFDFTGHPLESLKVFKYISTGVGAPLEALSAEEVRVECLAGEGFALPEAVNVKYNDGSVRPVAVTWDAAALAAIDDGQFGEYTVPGVLEGGGSTRAVVVISAVNYVLNPSFEDPDTGMWQVSWQGDSNPTDYQRYSADAHTGEVAFHFWSGTGDMEFGVCQQVTGLENGAYRLSAYAQGGDMADDARLELYAVTADGEQTARFAVTGWAVWKNPVIETIKVTDGTVTVGFRAKCNVKSWGTVDDFELIRVD